MHKKRTIVLLTVLCLLLTSAGSVVYGNTVITMSALSGFPYEQALPKMAELFEAENPGVKVEFEFFPFRNLFEITEVKMGAESPTPDVLFVDAPLVAAYTARGYLLPLDDFFSLEEQNEWVGASLAAAKVDDKLMTAPLMSSSQVLYYNKTIFEENGIAPLSKDVTERLTWEEVVELAQQLTIDEDGDGIPEIWGLGLHQINRPYQCLVFPNSLGGVGISPDGLKSQGYIDSPEWVEAFTFYQDLFNKYNVAPKGITAEEALIYFQTGRIAMFVGGDFLHKSFQGVEDLDWDFAPHPYFADGVAVTPTGSWHLGINTYSDNAEIAAEWIRFITTGLGAVEWFKADGHLPSNRNSFDYIENDPQFSTWPNNIYRMLVYEAENTAVPRPSTPGYLEWEQILTQAIEDIRNGANVEDTLTAAAVRIDRMLLKYHQ